MKSLVLVLVVLLAFSSCDNSHRKPNDTEAQLMAQNVIKAQFIDPDDPEFIDANTKMEVLKDSSWVFGGYIKAPNKLGLKVPFEYNIAVKWKGGDWDQDSSWSVKFCHITNPE